MTFKKTHGYSGTRIHANWLDMRYRCRNPNYHSYVYYGGRGITVCDRWDSFENFLADMGPKPSKDHTIDRIDNNGNYEPSNCRWATKTEQTRNRRCAYTPEDDRKLREAIALGYNFPKAAKYIGKSEKSVSARAYHLRLKSGTPLPKNERRASLRSADRGTP